MSEPAEVWQPEARPVPVELEPDYPHALYTAEPSIAETMAGVRVMDRLDEVMRQRLLDWGKEIR